MSLRIVASSEQQALAIRDHVLPLLRARGTLGVQRDTVRLIEFGMDGWVFRHWTPFNDLTPGEASSPGYRHAIERQRTQSDLPYGLGIWRGPEMLRILWSDDGSCNVVSFVRGPWESEALAL
jgi:hypothetical protein